MKLREKVSAMKAAAALAWVSGLGFGLPGAYGTWYLVNRGEVWTFMGFPTYGNGPFDTIGIETTAPLLVAFLLVCAAELVAGWLLWRHQRGGESLALVLLPFEFAFWIGFALPAGPVLGIARTALVATAWARRRRAKEETPGRATP